MKAVRPAPITPVPPPNAAPTIAAIADQITSVGTPLEGIFFTIADDHTAASALTVGANSSNTALLLIAGVTISGTGGTRQVRLVPVVGLTGSSSVTVTVSDGTLSSSRSFMLTVNTAGTPPPTPPPTPNSSSTGSGSGRCGHGSLSTALSGLALIALACVWSKRSW
ncbi:MAG TPA: hypothetical protein VHX44_10725 [Planctomycetota bacterium]|nr:hypothetical protein [Planctomycetota bacterium]